MTTAARGTAVSYAPHRDTLKERHPRSLFSLANQPSSDAPKTLGLLAEVVRWKRRQPRGRGAGDLQRKWSPNHKEAKRHL